MAFTAADIEAFIAALHEDVGLRDRVRNAILADDFLALPGIVRQLGERVDQLADDIGQLRVTVQQLVSTTNTLVGKVGNLDGWHYETRYRENVAAHLMPEYWRAKLISLGNFEPLLELYGSADLSREEWDDLVHLDLLASARKGRSPDAPTVLVAAELSIVVDDNDVRRIHRRAALLRRTGLEVDAVVDGDVVSRDTVRLATQLGVIVLHAHELSGV